jgi:hypothetical protein
MTLNTVLTKSGPSLPRSNNPMDLRSLLNPFIELPATSHNSLENGTYPDFIKTSKSSTAEVCLQLPPIELLVREPTHQQPALPYHLRLVNPSPPPSPYSPSFQQRTFTAKFDGGYPTPPPSSPHQRTFHQPEHYNQTTLTTRQQEVLAQTWVPTPSLSPREHTDQEQRALDPYWHVPVQVHSIQISHSSQYHSHPRSANHSRRGNNRVLKPEKRKRQGHHSNKPYTLEQVHWVRYHREDCQKAWPEVHALFVRQFRDTERLTESCLSSRYYRANTVPQVNENGDPVLDATGKVVMIPAKVRDRATAEGKNKPFRFVEKHPEFALVYDWVRDEDKAKAMGILQGLEQRTGEASGEF